MKAVILAGGLGTRLLPYTKTLPKPMLPLGKKPILEYVINWIKKSEIRDIVLCVSYKHKKVQSYFQDGKKFGVNIQYAISKKPLATAGQLKTAEKFVNDTFVCVYGDSIFDFNLKNMILKHKRKKSSVTMSLYNYELELKYGVIDTRKNGIVTAWNEKPTISSKINMGCYIFEPEVFRFIPKDKQYGMDTMIKKIITKKKRVSSFISKREFIDIGNKEIYEETNRAYSKKNRKK